MFHTYRMALLACLLALTGCTFSDNGFVKSSQPDSGVTLHGSTVYVYTFLDLREGNFGPSMLTALNQQLVAKLGSTGITAKLLPFQGTETGRYFPNTVASADIPVDKVVAANRTDETAAGARYRLIIFPLSTNTTGAWFIYDLRWELIDIPTGRIVWTVKSHGSHLAMWSHDEAPEGRAAVIVDGFLAEMKKFGLI